MSEASHWQLQMFKRTLKKKLRLTQLRRILGRLSDSTECLLVTCGDNNGAINYHLRNLGGRWSWADLDEEGIEEMAELLGEDVRLATETEVPYADGTFDLVVAIDAHEHVAHADTFTTELSRLLKEDGRMVITVPGGDRRKLVNRLKNLVGMTKEKYGHVSDGLSAEQIKDLMQAASILPRGEVTFSRFFTELIELGINFAYVNLLSGRSREPVSAGTIAPQTRDQVESVRRTYRLYSAVYPLFWLVSQLDHLLFFTSGYVVMVEGEKSRAGA